MATLNPSPPPFFRQGTTALTKLVFFSALALFLMVADTRLQMTGPLRSLMATAILPIQNALAWPVERLLGLGAYLQGLESAVAQRDAAGVALTRLSEKAARGQELAKENERLRSLLELRPAVQVKTIAAEVLFEAKDPFSRKVFIDKGASQGVVLGAPVVNEAGVLGQVTRVYPLSSEVTLLTDQRAAIPVLNARTLQRSAAFGGALGGGMELRFMAANADVKVGDVLTTSGVDGVYPAGLAVAKVAAVERRGEAGFARIALTPSAQSDGVRHVLVLEPLAMQLPLKAEPVAEPDKPTKADKGARK